MIKATRSSVTCLAAAIGLAIGLAGAAQAQTIVTNDWPQPLAGFPTGFMVPNDASFVGKPVLGFGGYVTPGTKVAKTPVIFLHGNGATPNGQGCPIAYTNMREMALSFMSRGYAENELWALGYQGDQCDLGSTEYVTVNGAVTAQTITPTHASRTHAANVPDLLAFVNNVLAYTGARQVDIVAHGMGVTLAREWARQTDQRRALQVRRFVAIDGPNEGTAMCATAAMTTNPYAGFGGGYTPDSPLCNEIGSPSTLFLQTLNRPPPAIDPKLTLVIRNGDSSYPFMPWADAMRLGVSPSLDKWGTPTDFSGSARIKRAAEVTLTGQSAYVPTLYASLFANAHEGIANSPTAWQAALNFLAKP